MSALDVLQDGGVFLIVLFIVGVHFVMYFWLCSDLNLWFVATPFSAGLATIICGALYVNHGFRNGGLLTVIGLGIFIFTMYCISRASSAILAFLGGFIMWVAIHDTDRLLGEIIAAVVGVIILVLLLAAGRQTLFSAGLHVVAGLQSSYYIYYGTRYLLPPRNDAELGDAIHNLVKFKMCIEQLTCAENFICIGAMFLANMVLYSAVAIDNCCPEYCCWAHPKPKDKQPPHVSHHHHLYAGPMSYPVAHPSTASVLRQTASEQEPLYQPPSGHARPSEDQ